MEALVGCSKWQTVHVLTYAQGQALSADYQRDYTPRRNQARWVGPPAELTRFPRTHPIDAPVIVGKVDLQDENGRFTPLPGTVITIDGAHIFADKAGNYVRVVGPGRHRMRAGSVGLLYSDAPPFHIERGDSIQINFHLLPEFRPTMN